MKTLSVNSTPTERAREMKMMAFSIWCLNKAGPFFLGVCCMCVLSLYLALLAWTLAIWKGSSPEFWRVIVGLVINIVFGALFTLASAWAACRLEDDLRKLQVADSASAVE